MEILIFISLFILCVIIGVFVGLKYEQHRKNEELQRRERKKYQREKDLLESEISIKKQELSFIQKEYNEKKEYVDSAKQRAEEEYETWQEVYLERYNQFQEYYKSQQVSAEEAIKNLQDSLESLSKQKAATIEAFQKEKAIQEQKDLYRLDISEQDKIDIGFLKSIQYRISRPRLLAQLIWQTYFQPIAKKKFPIILGSDNVCGIYKITNSLNQMCYIGQAKSVYKRFCDHCKCGLGIDTPQGNKLYKAMLEDGLENFTFEILEECSPEELDKKEKYYISVYNSVNFGYNSVKGNNINGNSTN